MKEDEDSQGYRTEDAELCGWVLVLRKKGEVKRWKRRFLEVATGEVREYVTDPPVCLSVGSGGVERVEIVKCGGDGKVKVKVERSRGEELMSVVCGSLAARSIAEWTLGGVQPRVVCAVKNVGEGMLDEKNNDTTSSSVLLDGGEGGEDCVLTWNDGGAAMFTKRHKRTWALKGAQIDTSEHSDGQHRLTVKTREGEQLVISVPDPLVLLRWVAALAECDIGSDSSKVDEGEGALKHAVNQLVMEETKRSTQNLDALMGQRMKRTYTLGVAPALGYEQRQDMEQEQVTSSSIKQEMLDAQSFPQTIPTLKEVLADQQMRQWAFKFAKTQFCEENVKFFIACDNLTKMTDKTEIAEGLKKVASEYVSSSGESVVNISGVQRKKFMRDVEKAKSDAELAALVPGILQDPLSEIVRVMEFDLYPNFSSLLREAMNERRSQHQQQQNPSQLRSIRDMYDSEDQLQEVLMFATGGKQQEQSELLFLMLVLRYKAQADAETRSNMASHIIRKYCTPDSPHFLESSLSHRRVLLVQREFQSQGPVVTLFDATRQDVATHVDATIMKRYFASKEQQPKKMNLLQILSGKKKPGDAPSPGAKSPRGVGGGAVVGGSAVIGAAATNAVSDSSSGGGGGASPRKMK